MKRGRRYVPFVVLSLSCGSGAPGESTRPAASLRSSPPVVTAALSAPPPTKSPVRIVRFDGGQARIAEEFLGEHIEIALDGRYPAESYCTGPTATYDRISAFFARFQLAVAADDRNGVVSMSKFPLRVNSKKLPSVASPAELLERWDRVFTARVKRKVASAEPRDVFCRDGTNAMFGAGVVWAEAADGELRISVVNR